MLSIKAKLKYLEHQGLSAKIVQLPYANSNLTFTIFFPNECGQLNQLVHDLQKTFDFMTLKSLFTVKKVELYLPKFTIDFTLDNIDPALTAVRFYTLYRKHTFYFKSFFIINY